MGKKKDKSPVPRSLVEKSVNSLLKWQRAQEKKLQQIDPKYEEESEIMYLVLNLKKIPFSGSQNLYRIPLPHPVFSLTGLTCLIIDDREKAMKMQSALDKITEQGLQISRVLRFSKLKSEFKNAESKRVLAESFDLILVDVRIMDSVHKVLGKGVSRKYVFVDLKGEDWKTEIEDAVGSALLATLSSHCVNVRVASSGQDREEVVENVVSVVKGIPEVVTKKWRNVGGMHLKFSDSLALPLYGPDASRLGEGQRSQGRKDSEKLVEGERKIGSNKRIADGEMVAERKRIKV